MDEKNTVINKGAIAIDDGIIVAVDAQDVQTVIVDGKVLIEDRKVLTPEGACPRIH